MAYFSEPNTPAAMVRGDVFSAHQYPRQAFAGMIDPVLNIDWFSMRGPTFPEHPHAGFSAVTYLFADSPNGFLNRDSLGQRHVIRPGGLHWSRAGRGLMHEEVPLADRGAVHGLQIFVNLPAASQADAPAAFSVAPEDFQTSSGKGWSSRIGVNGTSLGGTQNVLSAPVRIEEVAMAPGASFPLALPSGWGGVVIVLEGELRLENGGMVHTSQAVAVVADQAHTSQVIAGETGARLAIVVGQQLRQPVHAYGPLMLASADALAEARRHVARLSIPTHEMLA